MGQSVSENNSKFDFVTGNCLKNFYSDLKNQLQKKNLFSKSQFVRIRKNSELPLSKFHNEELLYFEIKLANVAEKYNSDFGKRIFGNRCNSNFELGISVKNHNLILNGEF